MISAKLDSAISGGKSEEKIASIRSRTAAKRVSVIDAENIGVDSRLERAKSTPDLTESKARKDAIYATPTVPGARPKGSPPAPPGADSSPKKPAPKPPSNTSFESSFSSEVVSIKTNKDSPYASTKVLVKSTTPSESPYESSFRPGDSAKMTEEPKDAGNKSGHRRTPSAGAVLVKQNSIHSQDSNSGVTFAEDKVLDHAASFLQKHPNAKLLMTAKGQESLRKRTSMRLSEPAPDYDSDSGEDKQLSPLATKDPKVRQSVTVISVGDKGSKPSSPASQLNKRYTIHSTIPSEDNSFVIPPRPQGPAPSPPTYTKVENSKSLAPPPPSQGKVVTVKVDVNRSHKDEMDAPPRLPDSQPPPLPDTPPPDFEDTKEIPQAPPPPPVGAAPPPPPPPPPAPSADDLSKVKSTVKADYISPAPVPQDAIAAAVAKRQQRMENQGPKMAEPAKPAVPQMDPTQAAIIAAVAKRRQLLETQGEQSVMESIESRLQKTKKLQAAKFSLAGSKPLKTEIKNVDSTKHSVQSSDKSKATVKAEKEEFSFKVEPVAAPKPVQTGLTQIKPNFAAKSLKTDSKPNSSVVSKPKPADGIQVKPAPIETNPSKSDSANNKTGHVEEKGETEKEQSKNEKNLNGQSDFLALAEKRRQEWLQRKQKSSESKNSSTTTSPDRDKFRTNGEKKVSSPPVSAKPVTNGDVYASVPPPPAAFRDERKKKNDNIVQLEIIPPPAIFSTDNGVSGSSVQHSPAFSPDTASVVSSLSTLSSLSGEGRGNGYDDVIAPPPPGFGDSDSSVIPPPPEFDSDKRGVKSFSDKPVSVWLCNDTLDWLDSISMSQYKSSFQRNCIDGKKLLGLTRNNYIDLGVTQVAHRMTIERSIKKAGSQQKTSVIASEHL